MNRIIVYKEKWIWILLVSAILLSSCAQTRFVPDEKYLLSQVELSVDDPAINKEEAKSYIRQKENYKILGFVKFYLFLYNLSSKKKTDDWLKRIGEAPQVYDSTMTQRSDDQLKQYFNNKGYYQAKVTDKVIFNEKSKKVTVKFDIKSGNRYTIKDIRYHFTTPGLRTIFMNYSDDLEFQSGNAFDIYELEKQQDKIVELYKNNGYYYFSKNQVRYLADTLQYEQQVVLDLFVGETPESQVDSTKIVTPFYLNKFNYYILPGNSPVDAYQFGGTRYTDTIRWDDSQLFLTKHFRYPTNLFSRTNLMQSGDEYKLNEVENTFNALNRLRQFRYVDIQFEESYPERDSNLLDCNIRLAPLDKQSVSLDLEGTNTAGNLGVAGNISYLHRNIFQGAEVLQLRLKGAMERMHRLEQQQYFNTRELGVDVNLTLPKLLGPGKYIRSFRRNLPKTNINVGYNYQRRPEYTRTISTVRFGYDWKTSAYLSHYWNFLDMNLVHLYEYDPQFIDLIKDLYIKSSFTDHFIFANNYSIVYNNQQINARQNYSYIRFNIESSGNSLWVLSKLTNQSKYANADIVDSTFNYYRFLNTQYAQYVKADIELRRGIYLDKYNSIVGRFFLGVGLPYGNSKVLPFEKQYFTGGANGIRAWQVRSLGPGTYKAPAGVFPNQSSDIKLEGNIEYRFKLLGKLEGALFVDAGNIWAINKYDNREGAVFKFDQFYKQIAVGTGTGLRLDLSYFILRIDYGMKLHDPSEAEGQRWIIGNRKLTGEDFNLNFAIGYPF